LTAVGAGSTGGLRPWPWKNYFGNPSEIACI